MDQLFDINTTSPLSRSLLTMFALVVEHEPEKTLKLLDLVALTGWSIRTLRLHLVELVKMDALRVNKIRPEHQYQLNLEIWFDPACISFRCRPKKPRTKWLSEWALSAP